MEKDSVTHYNIREASLADVPAVRRMHAASWLATYPNDAHGVPRVWVEQRVSSWLTPEKLEESHKIVAGVLSDPRHFYRLATMRDKVVGFVHIATNDDGTKELEAIYTDPETFGSGLARQLMDQADEWIDGTETTLVVATYNQRAIRFYEKRGFKAVEDSAHMYADKIPVIRMKREGVKR